MSQLVGKLSNALVNATNENSFQLANLQLDFAIVKVEAPEEFLQIGQVLTGRRKQEAEDGARHRTARVLGALFSQLVPPCTKLVKAFGKRASKIIHAPGANPKGTFEHGAFRDFVGADATSIWASATSGVGSLGVLLLASMLVRRFEDWKVSTAVLDEIVAARQREVLDEASANGFHVNEAVAAARQAIPRSDLAAFDNSVRAWLTTADQVMYSKHKQLELIMRNLSSVPVSHGQNTYTKIINAWTSAVAGFESLLDGKPQNVTDSSLLLALGAWHIYPNLIVLSNETKSVDFRDPLVPAAGVITVGLELEGMDFKSEFRWSLTLSHLRFYGEPVDVTNYTANFRMNVPQLFLVALGAMMSKWKLRFSATQTVAEWLLGLEERLQETRCGDRSNPSRYTWLQSLFQASRLWLQSTDQQRAVYEMCVQSGLRRPNFLGAGAPHHDRPLLGLANTDILHALRYPPGQERSIAYLRSISTKQTKKRSDESEQSASFITVGHDCDTCSAMIICTLNPNRRSSTKRKFDGRDGSKSVHSRWIVFEPPEPSRGPRAATASWYDLFKSPAEIVSHLALPDDEDLYLCTVENAPFGTEQRILTWNVRDNLISWFQCPMIFRSSGADHHLPFETPDKTSLRHDPSIIADLDDVYCLLKFAGRPASPTCPPPKSLQNTRKGLIFVPGQPDTDVFSVVFGVLSEIALCASLSDRVHRKIKTKIRKRMEDVLVPRLAKSQLQLLDQESLHEYISNADSMKFLPAEEPDKAALAQSQHKTAVSHDVGKVIDSWKVARNLTLLDLEQGAISSPAIESLHSLELVRILYEQLSCATFPTTIMQKQFLVPGVEKYTPQHAFNVVGSTYSFWDRAKAMACVCMLESGGVSLHPNNFDDSFAVAAGNSLYVSEEILSDPSKRSGHLRYIKGNLALPGTSVLIGPRTVNKKVLEGMYAVRHEGYDYKREDNFGGISLHLSLTNWRAPLYHGDSGLVDADVFLTEAVIAVREKGTWFGDIDMLKGIHNIQHVPSCLHDRRGSTLEVRGSDGLITSIDTMNELLDLPEGLGIVRARGNWAARVAAACLIEQQLGGESCVILPADDVCWYCVRNRLSELRPGRFQADCCPSDSGDESGDLDSDLEKELFGVSDDGGLCDSRPVMLVD